MKKGSFLIEIVFVGNDTSECKKTTSPRKINSIISTSAYRKKSNVSDIGASTVNYWKFKHFDEKLVLLNVILLEEREFHINRQIIQL